MGFDNPGKSPELFKPPEIKEAASNPEAGVEVSPDAVARVEMSESKPAVKMVEMPKEHPVREVHEPKNQLREEIEEKLADGLMEIYKQLPEDKRPVFKAVGEKLAEEIEQQMMRRKLRPHAVLEGLKKWLKIIPGVNWWYLTQEAKIKADTILNFFEEKEREGQNVM